MPDPSRTLTERTEIEDHGASRVIRSWHPNGILVKESRFKIMPDGSFLAHDVTRRWNSAGELIGSFEFVDGNGVQRDWYDNGQLAFENPMTDGKLTGLQRGWDESGYLICERFFYHGAPVSKKRYRELQQTDSTIPHYDDDAFRTVSQKRKAHGAE
jgi:antitoxin component YwqK of YwqJK toxin-antitoxin module